MAVTHTDGQNRPRIANCGCVWEGKANGDWVLRRIVEQDVVAHVKNLSRRTDYQGSIDGTVIVAHVRFLALAKDPIEQELDKRWSA